MRVIRGVAVAAMVLAQSAAAIGAVVAQDDLDPMAPAFFSYSMELDSYYPSFAPISDSWFVEATDPRASGLLVHNQDSWDWDPPDDETGRISVSVSSHAFRLTNDDGAWSGTIRSLYVAERRPDPVELATDSDMLLLTGEGDFEGLTLVLAKPNDDGTSRGVIVPTDSIPPFPELPAE
jgi:hypothetical protein